MSDAIAMSSENEATDTSSCLKRDEECLSIEKCKAAGIDGCALFFPCPWIETAEKS